MFGEASPMPGDKMMKLFIIQAISSFVSKDYETGLHFLNEIKTGYAQFMSEMNPTLKALVKEIIQSLDMFDPGASSASFIEVNTGDQTVQPSGEQSTALSDQEIQSEENSSGKRSGTVTNELQDLLERRRARRKNR